MKAQWTITMSIETEGGNTDAHTEIPMAVVKMLINQHLKDVMDLSSRMRFRTVVVDEISRID